ncbi:MAG: GNAT family N-acetyltransferase [Limimaricola sp.]|uniref:GNAT family N-acetyltransferase n=1 Tax=Limimaricola sp. TaxID=2211665 RepID=UPI001D3434D4|nr:GNAT family N-acetyltransferase [Limimaricola sp.]MBI1416927.1 GNAT family N-acetyltransferase [Limimaricola sp.]
MTMEETELDRPNWATLTSRHAAIAQGDHLARRFPAEISMLAGIPRIDGDSMAALAEMVAVTGPVGVAQVGHVPCPDGTHDIHAFDVNQMILRVTGIGLADDRLVRLGAHNAAAMLALATMTKPGPFALRTHELGEYWGLFENGELIAMAGERMKLPGYTEISGVCTRPDQCGKGLARRLCRHLVARIQARGETPFLHVETTKPEVEAFYARLGFETRQMLNVHVFAPESPAQPH